MMRSSKLGLGVVLTKTLSLEVVQLASSLAAVGAMVPFLPVEKTTATAELLS